MNACQGCLAPDAYSSPDPMRPAVCWECREAMEESAMSELTPHEITIATVESILRTSRSDADKVAAIADVMVTANKMTRTEREIAKVDAETRAIEARVLVSKAGY